MVAHFFANLSNLSTFHSVILNGYTSYKLNNLNIQALSLNFKLNIIENFKTKSVCYNFLKNNFHMIIYLLQVFTKLREDQPDFMSKLHAIEGDICEPELGMSDEDKELIQENAQIVVHSAATIRFDEPLKYVRKL